MTHPYTCSAVEEKVQKKMKKEEKMFKSNLQEMCQKKGWGLPEYSSTKGGLDHNPNFSASVVVNGLSFQTPQPFRSSKLAQNDAARIAFLHFSSSGAPLPLRPPLRPPPPPSSFPQPSLLAAASEVCEETAAATPVVAVSRQTNQNTLSVDSKDVQHLHKNQLQYFAQKRNLTLPVYSCEREGPPHAARFKCTVTIDGQTFQGQEFLPTVKDAEHAAAKVALVSLSPNQVEEDDTGLYKNFLQELLQKEGYHIPLYSTTTSGEPHMHSFVSTVEIEGEHFKGEVARNKKLAEVTAAKVAYKTLRNRKSSNVPLILTPAVETQGRSESIPSKVTSVVADDLQQQMRPNTSTPNSIRSEPQSEISVAAVGNVGMGTTPSSGVNVSVGGGSTSFGTIHARQPKTSRTDSPVPQTGFMSFAYDRTPDVNSTLEPPAKRFFSNKVSVYPRAGTSVPEGCPVLSLSDENWVAVSPMNQECKINQG